MVTLPVLTAVSLLAAAPAWELEPTQPGLHERPAVGCDAMGCFVSWSRTQGTQVDLWSVGVAPGGAQGAASKVSGPWSRQRLFGAASLPDRRLHFFDTRGTGGDTSLYLVRGSGAGALADLGSDVMTPRAGVPGRVSCDGVDGGLLCAYEVKVGLMTGVELRRLDRTGALLEDAGAAVLTGGNLTGNPRLVTVGGRAVLAWADRITTQQYDIYAAIYTDEGVPLAQLQPVSTLKEEEGDLTSAPIPGGALLAWTVAATPPRVQFAVVDGDAGVTPLTWALPGSTRAHLSRQGARWALATLDVGDAGATVVVRVVEGDGGLRVAWSQDADDATVLTTGTIDEGRTLLAFTQDDADAGGARLRYAMVGLQALGEPCPSPDWCAEGTCVAGVCAAPEVDAGAVDAGTVDAGAVDAGAGDAGPGPSPWQVGCDCRGAPADGALVLAWAAAMVLSARRAARRW